ncbi:hypothetical protein GQX73_g10864 [Xylaria multiplex]|uniref:DSBA-like thioredoxin domain-containing protein n=1 Tax=Xylaria multiplex TaxID=323545 RepID=A0A7C8MHW6_9PEZI|nr:hypothetical protein GQX73_g10864 [Xylaria multiplex]
MGAKLECYLDIASYYSYIAFILLQQNGQLLKQNEIEIEIYPYLLGAINVGANNRPPWLVPAKGRYSKYDTKRAADNVGLKDYTIPANLMEVGKTVMVCIGPLRQEATATNSRQPMRALTHIRSAFPTEVYTTAFAYMFYAFWTLQKYPNTASVLAEVLSEAPVHFHLDCFAAASSPITTNPPSLSGKLFTPEQVAQILDAVTTEEVKTALKARVDEALARGAFGGPWIWATNAQGSSEPFFGSDHLNFVYEFLGVPYQKMQLLPPQKAKI